MTEKIIYVVVSNHHDNLSNRILFLHRTREGAEKNAHDLNLEAKRYNWKVSYFVTTEPLYDQLQRK